MAKSLRRSSLVYPQHDVSGIVSEPSLAPESSPMVSSAAWYGFCQGLTLSLKPLQVLKRTLQTALVWTLYEELYPQLTMLSASLASLRG